ncbi:MAG: DUF6155 family protein [Bacteroides sp.]|nr:DUF6155 family protein [Bacteroides sp.]MCM1412767.1 DUF6155 family protein [Bacteroides sp.]MCM1470939.1 DUF6155 family protein [Bacteroides sp.]
MSKTQLKKELAKMTAGQIGELVLELYQARPQAREYLDFFLNPDIDAKLEKAKTLISREALRASRGRSKMRISRLKQAIKDIASLNPGDEPVCEIMTYTIEIACVAGSDQWIKDTTQTSIAKLMADTLSMADKAGLLNLYLPRIEKAIGGMRSPFYRPNAFKRLLKETLEDFLS